MIDQLINLVKQNASEAILKNPAIPDQKNDEAINDIAQNIFGEIQAQAKGGNIQQLAGLFEKGNSSSLTSNPIVAQLINTVTSSLATKFGIPANTAQQIASQVLPKVMGQFVNKTNDPNDKDFDLQDMLGKFAGNSSVGDLIGKIGGGGLGKMFGG